MKTSRVLLGTEAVLHRITRADAVAFLCSEESAHVTGEIVNVSGGWYLSP